MERTEFLNKIHPFSDKLEKLYLQQELQINKQFSKPGYESKKQDNIIQQDELQLEQETLSFLSLSDKFKRQTEITDISYLFEEWKSRYYRKISKMYKSHRFKQVMQLNAIKEEIIQKFGEVGASFQDMLKESSMCYNQLIASYRLIQNKQYLIKNIQRNETAQFSLVQQDFKRLMPGKDLNDALIDAYFKIMKTFILSEEVNKISHIFSTYLLHKLTFEIEQQSMDGQIDVFSHSWGFCARQEVKKKYDSVQKWSRKMDIFQKKILVFPINMHSHWFCVIVFNPGRLIYEDISDKSTIIFCDSLFQQRFFVVEAIREYLSLQLYSKRNLKIEVTEKNAPSFQMLLPRQVNKHDCGLYMLAYIQELLLNHKQHFANLDDIEKRNKLKYFPRKHLFSFRQRIMKLLAELYQKQSCPQKTNLIILRYIKEKEKIYQEAQGIQQFECVDDKELTKFFLFIQIGFRAIEDQEQRYLYLIKFSLMKEINYLQKDSPQESSQITSSQDSQYR